MKKAANLNSHDQLSDYVYILNCMQQVQNLAFLSCCCFFWPFILVLLPVEQGDLFWKIEILKIVI